MNWGGGLDHEDAASCWCQPELLMQCHECEGDGDTCWLCDGDGFMAWDGVNADDLVLRHREGE